ncbi:hypothetical protein B0H63DRAFT_543017 [Podospora didyma]|uniref:RING-type E3 ubiquitin transferase n=1 Tax=Podospora didyma TaxID=330526 RepID=A0AAE0TZ55_9PEZI|nr:hypothetical protein B0H63DRAFT_543017 [Podospora didyma]
MASTGAEAPANGGNQDQAPSARSGGDGNRGRGRGRGANRARGRGDASRGASGRGRGRGGRGGGQHQGEDGSAPQQTKPTAFKTSNEAQDGAANDDDDADVCFICANTIIHHSVSPCNHVTCHICALRMRALYKDKTCPHCRTAAPFVIFTDDGTKRFEEYTDTDIANQHDNIGVKYTSDEIAYDTALLLQYNCPDEDCDFAGLGWPDLHRHVRAAHHKKLCDLCTRHKKVFTHEHDMFADNELTEHMRRGDDKPGASDQTGFKGHPLCGFCGARFYDDDKLYEHCRNKHERCFLCDRQDSRRPHYYLDYNALEEHFKNDHYICPDRECLEKKFVVFASEIDLKAHQLSEHGGKDVRRDARVVDLSSFDFRPSYQQERRGGGASGREQQQRRRGPDPNSEPLPVSSAQQLRRDELAFQRQMAISSAQSQQSGPGTSSRPNPAQSSQQSRLQPAEPIIDAMQNLSVNDLSSLTPEQRASLTRHGAVIERAANMLGNDSAKMASFRSYISNYNKWSMTAEQLVDAFFSLFAETSSNALGTLVREAADLFDDPRKGEALRKAWQNWRAATEDYPSLPGITQGGANASASGWAAAAAATPASIRGVTNANPAAQAKHTTRVLKLKNSTRRGSAGGTGPVVMSVAGGSSSAASNNWGSSNRSAPSPSAFPSLPGAGTSTTSQPSWIGGSTPAITRPAPPRPQPLPSSYGASDRGGGGGGGPSVRRTGAGGEDAFPALPSAPKPTTTIFGYGSGVVRRDFGQTRSTGFQWGSGGPEPTGGPGGEQPQQSEAGEGQGGKGKKKNKKQVLVQWG